MPKYFVAQSMTDRPTDLQTDKHGDQRKTRQSDLRKTEPPIQQHGAIHWYCTNQVDDADGTNKLFPTKPESQEISDQYRTGEGGNAGHRAGNHTHQRPNPALLLTINVE